jgi:hypothetical protein
MLGGSTQHRFGGYSACCQSMRWPNWRSDQARLARAYLEHKVDLGVPNASDEAVLARVDEITAGDGLI